MVEVAGRPLIEWSLRALAEAGCVAGVTIAAPPGEEEAMRRLAPDAMVVPGGATRAESVSLALAAVDWPAVAVHDAARPLLSAELLDRLAVRLRDSDADCVIAAAPVADTLKLEGSGGEVERTVSRAGLWGAQTPQLFRTAALLRAQEAARERGDLEEATDEAWLIERAGGTVLLESTGAPNLKVTDSSDLAVAEALLQSQDRA
ncbi:MAG: 2-C-methyl-D-erythritol 4-phosphate cytidylyltransferase [Solirubrobacterales bacterium]|nr:2-C-methyl-D-erythritol 4-phosphate cytidylyltransferase [Solirubrobacterales bacterium]